MSKSHIIFAGCSFSDEGVYEDNFNINLLKEHVNFDTLRVPNTLKVHKYFALDLINQNLTDNIKIYTIARGSYGNHVIFDKLKKIVKEIKEKNPNDKIYAMIQLTALIRHGAMTNIDINIKDYPFDYSSDYSENFYESFRNIYLKHFENIENIHNFCEEENIIHKMYFGWANLFSDDFEEYNLFSKLQSIEKIVDFYKYNDAYDEMETYCAGKKPNKTKQKINNIDTYHIKGDNFGGLTEYGRDNLPIGQRYHLIFDAHPSSKSYYIFYHDIIKPWMIQNGLLKILEKNQKHEKILNQIFEFEYQRFMSTLETNNNQVEEISDISCKILRNNKLNDNDFIKSQFEFLNNKK